VSNSSTHHSVQEEVKAMHDINKTVLRQLSRRDTLKLSGLALGGLALGGGPTVPQGKGSTAKGKGQCEVGDC
jgi:hypothetical protein